MSEQNNSMNAKDFLIGALIGGVVGAATALLLSPKSGREIRSNISDGYHSATKKTQELARAVSEQSEAFLEKVKSTASSVKQDLDEWKDATKDRAIQVQEKVQEKVEDVLDQETDTLKDEDADK